MQESRSDEETLVKCIAFSNLELLCLTISSYFFSCIFCWKANYLHFDGFVVLHGTDTMAYAATALSFMLENLGKPVIFSGRYVGYMYLYFTSLCRRLFELLSSLFRYFAA
jgi:hypothetical protein